MSVETATRTGRLAFRGLCMQHGYNSKRLAEGIGMPEPMLSDRTTILLAAAKFCNWLIGEIGLCLLAVFGLPPLVGLAPWLPLPLIGGAMLAVSAGIMEEVLE